MKNICFIIPTTNSGGIETYLLRFLKLYQCDLNISVLVLNPNKGVLSEEYEKLKVTIIYHPIGYYSIFNFVWFQRFLKLNQFDVICDFNGNFAGIPILLANIAGVKKRMAWYRRSSNAFKPTLLNRSYNYLVKQLVRHYATDILSNSEHALSFFFSDQWKNNARYSVIRNGVPSLEKPLTSELKKQLKIELRLRSTDKIVGHIGRMDASKNHVTILKVAALLKEKDNHIKFVLCGIGTDSIEFLNEIEALNLENNVITFGHRDDISSMLQIFDVFYFPSVTEGQPNALLEAMKCNVPTVTSSIPPIREIFPKEEQYKLIDPLDATTAAQVIINILSDEALANQYRWQKWTAERFDMDRNFKMFFDKLIQ